MEEKKIDLTKFSLPLSDEAFWELNKLLRTFQVRILDLPKELNEAYEKKQVEVLSDYEADWY